MERNRHIDFVIPSEARDLHFAANCRSLASLGMTKSGSCLASDCSHSSAGRSKFTRSPRKPRVFQAPNAIPAAIQIEPAILAGVLRLSHSRKQITKPRTGGTTNDSVHFWLRTT